MVPVLARTRPGVLGIFDEKSVAAAEPLMDSVARGIGDVSASVPYDWWRSVVVYALSEHQVPGLASTTCREATRRSSTGWPSR